MHFDPEDNSRVSSSADRDTFSRESDPDIARISSRDELIKRNVDIKAKSVSRGRVLVFLKNCPTPFLLSN